MIDQYFRPRNWAKFQHYKQRQPPWIKLHRALLRDHDFTNLTELQQLHLIKLWLLYADIGKPLPRDCGWIAAQLKANPTTIGKTLAALQSLNYIELCGKDASMALAECKQSASPETETETETDKKEARVTAPKAESVDLKSQVFGPCLNWLAEQSSKPPAKLRPLVGKWCRDYGDAAVIAAMTHAARDGPVDPVAWIERGFLGRKTNGSGPMGMVATANELIDDFRRAQNGGIRDDCEGIDEVEGDYAPAITGRH